jgi:hypothetical protein
MEGRRKIAKIIGIAERESSPDLNQVLSEHTAVPSHLHCPVMDSCVT